MFNDIFYLDAALKKILCNARGLRFESFCGGFPSTWEFVGFCPIDASIQGWQGLPSGYVLWNRITNYYSRLAGTTFWPCESEFINLQRVWAEYALKRQEAVIEAFNAERLGDTLLPRMKLEINFRSGHRWSLSSWARDQLPTLGSFSLTVDPNGTRKLIILGHGNIHQTSGIWQNGHFEKSDPRWYIPGLDDRLKKIKSEYGKDQLGNITVDMVLGGLRGMTGLLWETSLLNPDEVLDAPAFQDDFYLNLVDWSSHNVLAVGLGNCVTKLYDLGNDDSVCRLGGHNGGTSLAVGTSKGKVQDTACCKRVRTMEGHRLRVGALPWSSSMLSSGSRDKSILQRASDGNDNRRQSQMSASNNMQLLTHLVLSAVMDVVSEGLSQTYVSYHM
ncbi:FIZZY-related 2-like protein [Tanacetum coccineum]|uniref:FIZZY-related 2-like protein n=1 Tax=Tanacetum coccineum TaxID=301880 RepID=A0ABQ5CZI7_9ASTR